MQEFVKKWVLRISLNFGAREMHCPRCGQQQVSEEIKFCSRCGLPLGVIGEVVAQGGYLHQLAELQDDDTKKTFFNKKNGVVFSVLWCILCFFLAIVFDAIFNSIPLGETFFATGIFGGIMILLISLVYLPSSKKRPGVGVPSERTPESLYGRAQNAGLPPQQTYPASDYAPAGGWRAKDTGDFAAPASVTDSTTKLLKQEE
jgi:hypothetical protein